MEYFSEYIEKLAVSNLLLAATGRKAKSLKKGGVRRLFGGRGGVRVITKGQIVEPGSVPRQPKLQPVKRGPGRPRKLKPITQQEVDRNLRAADTGGLREAPKVQARATTTGAGASAGSQPKVDTGIRKRRGSGQKRKRKVQQPPQQSPQQPPQQSPQQTSQQSPQQTPQQQTTDGPGRFSRLKAFGYGGLAGGLAVGAYGARQKSLNQPFGQHHGYY